MENIDINSEYVKYWNNYIHPNLPKEDEFVEKSEYIHTVFAWAHIAFEQGIIFAFENNISNELYERLKSKTNYKS